MPSTFGKEPLCDNGFLSADHSALETGRHWNGRSCARQWRTLSITLACTGIRSLYGAVQSRAIATLRPHLRAKTAARALPGMQYRALRVQPDQCDV